MNKIVKLASKYATGGVAFVAAGYLVFAIMTDNGGSANSQQAWKNASKNSISFDQRLENAQEAPTGAGGIDRTVTGSIRSIETVKPIKPSKRPDQELTVLELIRKNSNVQPGVSAGTGRVSVVVEKGDTLFGISQRHGIGIDALASLNGLKEPYTIKVGQTLYVAR